VKVLFLGAIGAGQTSGMRMRALTRLGCEVSGVDTAAPWAKTAWLQRQAERRVGRGRTVDAINASVLNAARDIRPDLIWAEKQEHLRADTLAELKRLGARLVHFTPDPYFSLDWKRTALMDAAISGFDVLVYCKAYERADYETLGRPLVYMPLGYCDEVHRPMPASDARWQSTIGFLGGWEPRRERLLHAVADAVDDLKVWGGYWDFLRDGRWTPRRRVILGQLAGGEPFQIHRDPQLADAWQGGEVYADDYARALSGAAIGLGFLRQVCPDQHTTRTFEIPACGSLLLADRTDEHLSFFEEGREAEFFGSQEELVDKTRFYSAHDSERTRIAAAGLARCRGSGYAYVERLRSVMSSPELGLAALRPRSSAPAARVAGI
jgi:hypothetical protein